MALTASTRAMPRGTLARLLIAAALELLVEAGLSPMEALSAATRNAAGFLGQAGQALGTVEPGKAGDLVVLARDPLSSITATQDVEVVIRGGRVVWRK
jgi:imidazolonepropionase-like amidohydrolase